MEKSNELLEFAKWLIHNERQKYTVQQNYNAAYFASDLMSTLCARYPFESEHRVIAEWEKYKKENNLQFT